MPEQRPTLPTAGYLAQPHEVHRVVLLYSGGLDTSVMLKWIQDEYDAEVVALCIDLGQPADDFDAVRRKALDLGARGQDGRLAHVRVVETCFLRDRSQGGHHPFVRVLALERLVERGRPGEEGRARTAAGEDDAAREHHEEDGKEELSIPEYGAVRRPRWALRSRLSSRGARHVRAASSHGDRFGKGGA